LRKVAEISLRPESCHPAAGQHIRAVPATRPPGQGSPTEKPVTVAIWAGDPIIGVGAAAYLRTCPGLMPVPADRVQEADVVLVITTQVTEKALSWMCRTAEAAAGRGPRFVLVGDGIREPQLLRAVTCGVVSAMPWEGADYQQIVHAIERVLEGRADLPGTLLSSMISRIAAFREDGRRGAPLLCEREMDVIGLLADGLGTAEIARHLNYSERTVKSIVHGVITRLNLRNRSHAVAFAIRSGLL
jgi:DNA-binding NarL/FixJ family response regulator